MIEKNEVLKLAHLLNLRPDTVEKDYVLGWMLLSTLCQCYFTQNPVCCRQ